MLRQRFDEFVTRQPLTPYATAAVAGVVADRAGLPSGVAWTVFLIAATWLVGLSLARRTDRPSIGLVGTLVMAACLFAIRHHREIDRYQSATILSVLSVTPEPTILIGVVDETPRIELPGPENWSTSSSSLTSERTVAPESSPPTDWETRLGVRVDSLRRGLADQPMSGRVRAHIRGDVSELRPGDRIELKGEIALYDAPSNPGESDRRLTARADHLHGWIGVDSPAQVTCLSSDRVSTVGGAVTWAHRWLASLSTSARETLIATVGEQYAGLAVALVLGQRDLLDESTSENLMVTGTAHLLSVSGLHLGIVVVLARLIATLLGCSIRWQIFWIFVVALFYVAITGGRPPVLRSGILLSTLLLSILIWRPHSPLNSLSLAVILIAWWSPQEVFGVGTQLSFLAVATLLLCGVGMVRGQNAAAEAVRLEQEFDALHEQSLAPRWRRVRWVARWVGRAVGYSGTVTVMTLPLVWSQFHVVSPVSVVINVVLSPLMAISLTTGIVTVLLGWTVNCLAWLPGMACHGLLATMATLISAAAEMPGGHLWLPSPPTWWVMAFYIGIATSLMMRRGRRRHWVMGSWCTGWLLVAWWIATTPPPLRSGTIEATFVDVGHGTAVVIRPTADEVWLYDGGWLGNARGSSRGIEDTLWSLGATRIRGVMLSHADTDHYNAFPGLSRRFKIDRVITPPGMLAETGESLRETLAAIKRQGIEVVEVHRGEHLQDVAPSLATTTWMKEVSVLHPPAQRLDGSDNANSLVIRIDCGKRCLILPGDLEPPGTAMLIDTPRPPAGGVLMAPHHGSLQKDAESVLRWARPAETIVSGGRRAERPEVTELLSVFASGVHVTCRVGAVRVRLAPEQPIDIKTWRADPW